MQVITSKSAPQAIGPYSQAIRSGNLIFCSGQVGLSPETGLLAGEDIGAQTEQTLRNLKAVLEEAGSDLSHVVKVTVFITDMKNYAAVNDIYAKYFSGTKPARSAVQVSKLPREALVEIECIAVAR